MTIKDIAKLSGCGVATVSRVLNDHPDVSDETRRKVLAVVEEQGFQPNNNAKHLKQQSSTSIAIIVKGIMNMLFADLVEKVQALLRDAGQDAAVYYLDEDANEVAYACQLCRERRPMGILFLGGDLELFEAGFASVAVPCVLLTNTAQELGFSNLSSFTTDDHLAAQQVVELLAAKGHTHIGLLGGNWSCSQISYSRLSGCRDACQRLGLPFDVDRQCEPCRYSMPEAYAATKVLLERCPDLTAIFAVSDVMAMGAISPWWATTALRRGSIFCPGLPPSARISSSWPSGGWTPSCGASCAEVPLCTDWFPSTWWRERASLSSDDERAA